MENFKETNVSNTKLLENDWQTFLSAGNTGNQKTKNQIQT
jgi:hypothetical protein